MNNRTTFALLALLIAVGTLTMSTAYAQTYSSCIGCTPEEAKIMAAEDLIGTIPISVWTEKTDYGHNDMIMVT